MTVALQSGATDLHLEFSYGKSACPGRFFAASELKVSLAHNLMKYDFKVPEGVEAKHRMLGASYYADLVATLPVRRRKNE
ncbi:Cytochrome P450 monooxygenase trt6 [Trichoderma lentiforme]|uniref:Cytochrome P450 monooxygenase trt6 n=1 Tax=Trichoderma lentiforme TaxID=1567552 RepID=A0A9P4XMW5_9HYPO|nr:Cytochrome P450 monooxygenase trt6 [Trichoderma lentiforme]